MRLSLTLPRHQRPPTSGRGSGLDSAEEFASKSVRPRDNTQSVPPQKADNASSHENSRQNGGCFPLKLWSRGGDLNSRPLLDGTVFNQQRHGNTVTPPYPF